LKYYDDTAKAVTTTSPSVRKVWIEMLLLSIKELHKESPSVRKVWIEMHLKKSTVKGKEVTFCEEGVD